MWVVFLIISKLYIKAEGSLSSPEPGLHAVTQWHLVTCRSICYNDQSFGQSLINKAIIFTNSLKYQLEEKRSDQNNNTDRNIRSQHQVWFNQDSKSSPFLNIPKCNIKQLNECFNGIWEISYRIIFLPLFDGILKNRHHIFLHHIE